MLEALKGRKTYLLSIAAGLATIAWSLGYIDVATYTTVMGIVAPGAMIALRAGVEKSNV